VRSADFLQLAARLSYRVAPPNSSVVGIYYIGLIVWCVFRRRRAEDGSAEGRGRRLCRRLAPVVALAAAFWILAEPWAAAERRGNGMMQVSFMDVGQGDSALVRFPRGATLLVDTGGLLSSSFDIGDRVVAPVLRDAGVRRLDYLALTHGDPDHIGGAASIIREFRPAEVWEGIPVPRFAPLRVLKDLARASGSRWANVYHGDRITVDGVAVIARRPDVADWERQQVRNDDSMVLELVWRDVSFVLAGDIGKAIERVLAAEVSPSRLRVLKVAHHGSLTSSSSDFLRALHPQVAVISAGRSNHFGHPVPEVLQRYRAIGAEIFRTDQDGAVTVETDGKSIDVHTFTGRHVRLPPTAH